MSKFTSKFESIEKLSFYPVTSRPISVVKAVSYEGVTAMLGVDGYIYTNAVKDHVFYSSTTGRHSDLFRCCKKLGVLSSKVIQQHIALEEQRSIRSNRKWRANQVMECVKELGLRLTKTQEETVKSALSEK